MSLLQQPNTSNPPMTCLRSFQISLQGLVDSLVSTQFDPVLMSIPSYMLPRNVPLPYIQRSRNTSTKWNTWGVMTHVDQPTDWVSSINYVQKTNGELHQCLDPHDLNRAICHDHHKMPTVAEGATEFAHSCYFTMLDAHHAYWLIRNPAYSQPSTAPLGDTASCIFPSVLSVPKISSRRIWTRSSKSVKDALGLQITSLSSVTLKQNTMPISGTSCMSPANMG